MPNHFSVPLAVTATPRNVPVRRAISSDPTTDAMLACPQKKHKVKSTNWYKLRKRVIVE